LLATYPLLSGCAKKAEAGIPAVSLDGASIELEKAAINELVEAVSGDVMLANDTGYDSARRIWNGMHDKRPALIVQPSGTADVVKAVEFARDNNLLLAVKGGGHSWPGKSAVDGGLMLDLGKMNAVDVDREARTARAGGGALLNNLDTATLEQGLVTTAGVVSHTGVGGFTLGGGFGRLNRKFGLTIDNLLGAEIVTADGKLRYVSAEQEPDLFWAIRGGGGNFGVVTGFDYRLHPFDRNVLSGMIVWPVDQARDVLEFYGEWYEGLSNDLYVGPAMMTLPDGTSVIAMEMVYAGDPAAGEKEMAALRAIGKPMDDGIKVQDYMVMQTQEDATFSHGIRSYAKNGMAKEVSPQLVTQLVESFRPDPRLAFFTHTSGGVVMEVDETDTAFPHRNAETMIIVAGGWMDPEDDESAMASAREWFAELEPHTGGYYDNIEFEGADSVSRNYGPNFKRLQSIKAEYDPGNLFRMNSNIEPAS
jgi:FAD/FMN-containing dehydrogenase